MRIGVSLAYWPWFGVDEQVELTVLADQIGLDSVWLAESYGQDAVALLGFLAARTERIQLGSAILQIPARQAATTAMAATTLDILSGGRLLLGLGLSGPQVSEGWYGVPFTAPLGRTREYVEIIRQAWTGEPLRYAGTHWRLPLRGQGMDLGKPLRLMADPVRRRIPIYLGVGGPKTVQQAGEIADGWLPFLFSAEHADLLTEPLLRGIGNAGRDRGAVDLAAVVPAAVHQDIANARDQVRPMVAFYLGAMGAREQNFYVELAERYGFGASARTCQQRYLSGDKHGAAAVLSDELLDTMALTATPATLDKRLAAYETAGVDTLVVTPFGDRPQLLRMLAGGS